MPVTEHSPLGGSGCERWSNCPGSIAMACALPEPPESTFAAEGSAAHEFAEMCLRNGFDAHQLIGRVTRRWPEWPMTEEMADAVQVYVDFCRSFKEIYPDATTWIEKPFVNWMFDFRFWGTSDFGVYIPDTKQLHVVDYKHGAGIRVYVRENKQLMFYGLGAMLELGQDVESIELHIVQPRAGHKDAVNSWVTTPDRLMAFGEHIQKAAERTDDPDAPRVAGKWCKFCPGAQFYKCPEHLGWSENMQANIDEFISDANGTAADRRALKSAVADFATAGK